jgi:hypothetical protein
MTQAATGFRVHSGWAAAVTVAGPARSPAVVDRRRIELAKPPLARSKQPYHAAEGMPLGEAGEWIESCRRAAVALAWSALEELRGAHAVEACGLLLAAGRPLPALEAILRSHSLIHTAEGELFRQAIRGAAAQAQLEIHTVAERALIETSASELRLSTAGIEEWLAGWGRKLGPPWRQDEKYAALAAWLALTSRRGTVSGSP